MVLNRGQDGEEAGGDRSIHGRAVIQLGQDQDGEAKKGSPVGAPMTIGYNLEGGEDGHGKEGRELRLLSSCMYDVGGKLGRRGLKVNAGKSKVTVLNGEEGLEHEVRVDEIHLKQEFKYFGYVLDESGTDGAAS